MFYNCNGNNIYYEDKGKGKNVVAFFNGVMASAASWNLCVPVFEKFGFRTVCHDFLGQLGSDKPIPQSGIYSFQMHAQQAKSLFDYLGVDKVHIIGTSYGGEVAMKFASMYPDTTASISIIDSVSEVDEVCKAFVLGWKPLCDTDGETFFKGMAPSIYGPDYMEKNKELLSARAKGLNAINPSYFVGQKILYDTFAQDIYMTEELSKITCPTLIIVGQDDILKPQKFSEIIYKNIPQSEFVVFPHCGHVTIFEQPNTLNSVLLGFVLKNC